MFGAEISAEFRGFLDRGPPVPFDTIIATLEREWGCPVGDVLEHIEPRPIGCASLAVVHRARLKGGEEVAIKVLRPRISEYVALDMGVLQPLTAVIARRFGVGQAEPAVRLFDGLSQQLSEELDFRLEARAMHDACRNLELRPQGRVSVPRLHDELSTRRVLVADYIDGVAVDNVSTLADWNIDAGPLISELLAWWFTCAFDDIFHADLHAGNLLVSRDGRLYVLDWGIVFRLDAVSGRFFRRLLEAVLGDERAWPDALDPIVDIWENPPGISDEELALMLRGMLTAIFTRPFAEVDLTGLIVIPDRKSAEKQAIRGDRDEWMSGGGPEFERHVTVLVKQLLYLERYGKLHLADKSLLHDRDFFTRLLAKER